MPRLGELLVAGGLLTSEQVDQALRAQVMWGGRLGTNLIELGVIDLDALSRSIGLQHKLPSALARHFEKIDKDLQKLLSADVAEKFSVVPLMRVGTGAELKIVVAALGPLEKKPLAIVADDMGYEPEQVVVTVAAELRIRYQLERAYNIPRDTRFLRSRGPAFPVFTAEPEVNEISDVGIPVFDGKPPEPEPEPEPEPAEIATARAESIDDITQEVEIRHREPEPSEEELKARRRYVKTLSDTEAAPVEAEPATPPVETEETKALGRIALRKIAATVAPIVASETPTQQRIAATLGEATRAIRRAGDRDKVVDLMMLTIDKFAPGCEAALLLVVRGDAATSWRGFSRTGRTIPEIALPLEQSGLAHDVIERRATVRCEGDELSAIDSLLFRALGAEEGDLMLVPVVIGNQVMCLIAMVGTETSEIEAIATAGGAAFARLMRDASR